MVSNALRQLPRQRYICVLIMGVSIRRVNNRLRVESTWFLNKGPPLSAINVRAWIPHTCNKRGVVWIMTAKCIICKQV